MYATYTIISFEQVFEIREALDIATIPISMPDLDPTMMFDITDATEASKSIMLGLNHDWFKKQGDLLVESLMNFVTAIIWSLKV